MEEVVINPLTSNKMGAYHSYRVDGDLYTIPFVIAEDLTLKRSKDKYVEECRRLPLNLSKMLDEKKAVTLSLSPPVELKQNTQIYQKESSSQHMHTILDGIDEAGVQLKGVDILVAAETLNKIAGSVLKQENSWKLRAYSEIVQGKKMILLCDDDFNEIDLTPPWQIPEFSQERREALSFAQQLCERDSANRANPYLHGSLVTASTIRYGCTDVRMIVVGEVDMVAQQKSINTYVMTGRTSRIGFGFDKDYVKKSFDYLWSRCFWLGMTNCLIGMRSDNNEPVKNAHLFNLQKFYLQHRGRMDNLPDIATSCVAQVIIRLREAVESIPTVNWIIEYEGRDESVEPGYIKIKMPAESRSFWLVRENYHILKETFVQKKTEQAAKLLNARPLVSRKLRVFIQKKRAGMKISKKGNLEKQFRNFIENVVSRS